MEEFKKMKRKNFRKEQIMFKLREAGNKVKTFCYNNKETIITLTPAVIAAGGFIVKNVVKSHNIKSAERVKNQYCYDRSLGHYWKLRRELTNSEWVEVDRRKKAGERLGDILESMKVLA